MNTENNTDEAGSSPVHGSPSVEEFLAEEIRQLRKAGCKLAEAALHVARECDGVHRLLIRIEECVEGIAAVTDTDTTEIIEALTGLLGTKRAQ